MSIKQKVKNNKTYKKIPDRWFFVIGLVILFAFSKNYFVENKMLKVLKVEMYYLSTK